MGWFDSVGQLQRRAQQACETMAKVLRDAALSLSDDDKAWGQFLEYPKSNTQHGVYGTACAVKTLALLNEPASSDFLTKGQRWLCSSIRKTDSRANQKGDYALLYKYAFLIEALEPTAKEVSAEVGCLCRNLLERRLGCTGWGEHYASDQHRSEEPGIIPTAMALYVLRRYVPFAGSESCKKPIKWAKRRGVSGPAADVNALELALVLLVLEAFAGRHDDLRASVTRVTAMLERKVKQLGMGTLLQDWCAHHFSELEQDGSGWRNHYVCFLTPAIVAAALMKSGAFPRNRRLVLQVVASYVGNVEKNRGSRHPAQRRMATVDHYWLALALGEFLKVEAEGRVAGLWQWLNARHWRNFRVLVTLLILVLYAWLTYFELQAGSVLVRSVVGSVLMLIMLLGTWLWGRRG